jgi:hypothetical protein
MTNTARSPAATLDEARVVGGDLTRTLAGHDHALGAGTR